MIYLLDANVLITAHTSYYPVDTVPEFWAWLAHHCAAGTIKMPIDTFEEESDGGANQGRNLLYNWIQDDANKTALLLPGEADPVLVRRVVSEGYAPDLTDDEVEGLRRDPFLIAHALAVPADRCVVTTEVSKPSKTRQNRKVPDVCATVGVRCCDTFTLLRALRFSTDWQRRS
jgi:hypothetical protein